MGDDLFTKLREQLDQYSAGFPATESGVEMRILKKLFTEDEAAMFLNMSLAAETPGAVARRTGLDAGAVAGLLERMAEKGLLFRLKKEGEAKYAAAAFVVGIYEFQLNRMDLELAELVDQYMQEAFGRELSGQTVQMRTVPVGRSVDVAWPVAPYEDLREIIRSKDRIAVANCICRVQKGLLEQACDKPLEVCFSFGSHGEYYVDRGMGRWIDQEEALAILKRSEEAGLVPQPFNAQNPGGMCNCCGDCCGMLVALKKHPKPAQMVLTNYFAQVDPDRCTACETCLDRCQMEAVAIGPEGVAVVDRDRCIGCGLCVTTCPEEAVSLKPIPSERRREPPPSSKETFERIARERGKSLVPLAFAQAGS
jgi:Na+-translocating ferredoxin:NAD+ oxidoreductase subunit B